MAEPYITKEELNSILGDKERQNVSFIPLTDEIKNKYLDEAKGRAEEILHIPSIYPTTIKGNCWYLSNNGNDELDGKSEETAWKTTERLHKAQEDGTVKRGDGVFFERGSVWDSLYHTTRVGDYALKLTSGVTYSSYGYGEKPLFRNCIYASKEEDWLSTVYPNVWKYNGDAGVRSDDIGNIIFDNGRAYGIKVSPRDPNNPYRPDVLTDDSGLVTNKFEYFHSGGTEFTNPGCLAHNLEYVHDYNERTVYLYWDKGNPASEFSEIIFARRGVVIRCEEYKTLEDVVVDNLAVKYGGSHGLQTFDAKNVLVQNCVFGWIGGSFQENDDFDTVRFGNAVENWGECDKFIVRNCIAYECYDTAFTTQSGTFGPEHPIIMKDVDFSNNVIAYSNYPIEIWCPSSMHSNEPPYIDYCLRVRLTNNYCVYSGYHFGHQRGCKNGNFIYVGGKNPHQIFLDSEIRYNKFIS